MKIQTIKVGELETNCYLVSSENGETLVIDPGEDAGKIIKSIEACGLRPVAIVITHGHPDHIGAVVEINKKYNAPIYIHIEDAHFLTPAASFLGRLLGYQMQSLKIDQKLKDNQEIKVGNLIFKVLHTPGHSPGGICLLVDHVLFSGDTLFEDGVGRTDLYGGSEERLWKSIKEKLFILPDETIVYPGHGPSTTIGKEKKIYEK